MKKRFALIIGLAVVLIWSFLIGTGFRERTDVVLVDYSASVDGSVLLFDVQVSSSAGYVRSFGDKREGQAHYLTFYSAFGGFNGSVGAAPSFELEVCADDVEIYFARPDGAWELILVRDEESGQWERQGG